MPQFLSRLDVQNAVRIAPKDVSKRQEYTGLFVFGLLFFSWGLAYGLLDIMNYHIKVAMGIDRAMSTLLALAYYGAYLVAPLLVAGPLVRLHGYRLAAVVGLVGLGLGDFLMSVAASHLSFAGMCGAHFVVGIGVSILERTANAYAVNIGPRKRAPFRILVDQTLAALGTVIAPLLANNLIFDQEESLVTPASDPSHPGRCLMPPAPAKGKVGDLSTVVKFYQWLGCSIFALAFALLVFFFRTQLVREPLVEKSPKLTHTKLKFWEHPLLSRKYFRLWYGVTANFVNLGCQVAFAQFFIEHMRVDTCATDRDGALYMMYAQIMFMVGRLIAAGLVELPRVPLVRKSRVLNVILKSRFVLSAFLGAAVVFTGVGIDASSTWAITAACMVMFFESPSFPMIFESATAGLGEWTSTAESITITSISGGGIMPLAMGALTDHFGVSKSWLLVTLCFGFVFSYTFMCNIVPSFRREIDAAHEQNKDEPTEDIELEAADESV